MNNIQSKLSTALISQLDKKFCAALFTQSHSSIPFHFSEYFKAIKAPTKLQLKNQIFYLFITTNHNFQSQAHKRPTKTILQTNPFSRTTLQNFKLYFNCISPWVISWVSQWRKTIFHSKMTPKNLISVAVSMLQLLLTVLFALVNRKNAIKFSIRFEILICVFFW